MKRLAYGICIALSLAACRPNEQTGKEAATVASIDAQATAFLGAWATSVNYFDQRKDAILDIRKNGTSYILKANVPGSVSGIYPMTYANGVMDTHSMFGALMLTDNNQTLVFIGDRFHRPQT